MRGKDGNNVLRNLSNKLDSRVRGKDGNDVICKLLNITGFPHARE